MYPLIAFLGTVPEDDVVDVVDEEDDEEAGVLLVPAVLSVLPEEGAVLPLDVVPAEVVPASDVAAGEVSRS